MAPQVRSVRIAQKTAMIATIAATVQAIATTVPMTSLKRIHAPTASTMTARSREPIDGLDSVSSMPSMIRTPSVARANQVREARRRVPRARDAQPRELVDDTLLVGRAAPDGGERDDVRGGGRHDGDGVATTPRKD